MGTPALVLYRCESLIFSLNEANVYRYIYIYIFFFGWSKKTGSNPTARMQQKKQVSFFLADLSNEQKAGCLGFKTG